MRNEGLEGEKGRCAGRACEVDRVRGSESIELPERRGLHNKRDAGAACNERRVEQPERVTEVTMVGCGRGVRRCRSDVMGAVVVMNQDRVAIRIIASCVPPIERATAHNQCEQGCECLRDQLPTDYAE
jgi:hypothetical protein